ncbi:MAG: hypothetical protein GX446_09030 [Chthonomonadales bacterium]|nr:hypothetical protein [Chthonomonadales bacterium]
MAERETRLTDRVAFLISAAASPFITVSACALAVIATHTPSLAEAARYALPFLALTIALPGAWILVGVRTGRFTDPHVMLREQRAEPFMVANVGALGLVLVYVGLHAPVALQATAANMLANGLVFMLITRFWKVSIHAAAYAASVLVASVLVHPSVAWLGLGFPLVVWSRLRRQRHSLAQALVAAAMVTASTVVVLSAFGLLGMRGM